MSFDKLYISWWINSVIKLIISELISFLEGVFNVLVIVDKSEHIVVVSVTLIADCFNTECSVLKINQRLCNEKIKIFNFNNINLIRLKWSIVLDDINYKLDIEKSPCLYRDFAGPEHNFFDLYIFFSFLTFLFGCCVYFNITFTC